MANEKDYIPEGTDTDGKVKDGDDLKEESKKTLADYMTSQSYAVNNAFRPKTSDPLVEVSLKDGNKPAEFQTGGESETVGFTRSFPSNPKKEGGAVGAFETTSDSGKFTLSDFMDKNSQSSGHNLLRNIKGYTEPGEPGIGDSSGKTAIPTPIDAPEVQKQISAILTNGN